MSLLAASSLVASLAPPPFRTHRHRHRHAHGIHKCISLRARDGMSVANTRVMGSCAGDTCEVLAHRMGQSLRAAERREQGACRDLAITGVFNHSSCQTAPHDRCLGGRGTWNPRDDLPFGLGEDDICCACGGGESPSHAYDWLRVYYREGAYRREYPRINVTDLGRTGLLPADASTEAEWAGWLRGAGFGGTGAVPAPVSTSDLSCKVTPVWIFNLLENAFPSSSVAGKDIFSSLKCCPRPMDSFVATSFVGCRCECVCVSGLRVHAVCVCVCVCVVLMRGYACIYARKYSC